MRSTNTRSEASKTNSIDFTDQRKAKKMQYGSSGHHAKHQLRKVDSEDYEVRESRYEQMPSRLLDPPPYADFYMTSYSFDFSPETQNNVGEVDYNQPAKYKVNDQHAKYKVKDQRAKCKVNEFIKVNEVEYNQRSKYKVDEEEEEDVNAEADDFIKHEHNKFKLRHKTMSFFR